MSPVIEWLLFLRSDYPFTENASAKVKIYRALAMKEAVHRRRECWVLWRQLPVRKRHECRCWQETMEQSGNPFRSEYQGWHEGKQAGMTEALKHTASSPSVTNLVEVIRVRQSTKGFLSHALWQNQARDVKLLHSYKSLSLETEK